jgi:16S rRNA (cytosine967-C5)-methyltransferase
MTKKVPGLKHSLPDWWELRCQEWLGERWPRVIEALNQRAPVFLRTNTLKTSPEELLHKLKQEGLECEVVPEVSSALKLRERANVFVSKSFRSGLFEVQDAGSQCLSPLLKVRPGERVVDACAGAGGKTLHMAAMMGNKGKIIAMDIHSHKLEELKRRARRNSVDIVETRVIENRKVIKRLKNTADAVLLDVPCSGSGVLRRSPDTKWKLGEDRLEELVQIQRDILSSYSQMCKPGGRVVYATCSVFPLENQDQVKWFLEQSKNGSESWKLEEELVIHPETTGFDGFYGARLSRIK